MVYRKHGLFSNRKHAFIRLDSISVLRSVMSIAKLAIAEKRDANIRAEAGQRSYNILEKIGQKRVKNEIR